MRKDHGKKTKAMTERVIQKEHPERTVHAGSGLWENCTKTIPELRAEKVKL